MLNLAECVRNACVPAGLALMMALSTPTLASAAPITLQDAQGRKVTITDSSRIISIGGAITEVLYALGLEERIIGVDVTSLYPPRAMKEKPSVGYMRALSPEGVLGLGPSLVLANDGSGPKEAVAVLEAASVPFVRIPDHFNAEGVVERVRMIAAATGTPERGECLAREIESGMARLAQLRAGISRPARVAFVLSFTNGRPMMAGRNTAADGIIKLAGGVNVFSDFEGYKAVNDEAVVAAQPDAVVGMIRDGFDMTADEIFKYPSFALTPAGKTRTYISMDGGYLLGFGPRTAQAATELAKALYPQLASAQPAAPAADLARCRQ
jgi:iron complex transport system substrate-binding protein